MACTNPLKGYRHPDGVIRWDPALGDDEAIEVGCGQCASCKIEYGRNWSTRCMHEASLHEENCFITLTLNDENCPADMSLNAKTWQDFAKRFRKNIGPFRYYACGEYTEDEKGNAVVRPHYHACIFGHDFHADRYIHTHNKYGDPIYRSPTLEDSWKLGFSTLGELTRESAQYVARYVLKKQSGPKESGAYWGRKPPFAVMSRNPGLGTGWIKKWWADVYPHDYVVVEGEKTRTPRFYDKYLESKDPAMLDLVKANRIAMGKKLEGNYTREKLAGKNKVLLHRMKQNEYKRL